MPTRTVHRMVYADSAVALKSLDDASVDLLVTSPPYPMIEMWDRQFVRGDRRISNMLASGDGASAQRAMHEVLGRVWRTLGPKMKEGAIACVNMGDSTRSLAGSFVLYPNHAEVISVMRGLGFDALPEILWRKTSNKPNKFLGSGMLPGGAYVTQEHEYILLFRKGKKRRVFVSSEEREARRRSAYFWEERNAWFSDVWEDVHGERQSLAGRGVRKRSAAFPFELAYRLISMFSVAGDLVVDPFAGTCVTTLAAIASGRNSLSIEIDERLRQATEERILAFAERANRYNLERLSKHARFAESRSGMRYVNATYGFPVMTRQETSIEIPRVVSVSRTRAPDGRDGRAHHGSSSSSSSSSFEVEYAERPFEL